MVNLSNVKLAYGDRVLFQNGTFLIRPNDKIGLVGPNGSGKSSIFKIITGLETLDEGTVSIDPGLKIGYFSQDVGEISGHTALEQVLSGAGDIYEIGEQLTHLEKQMCEPLEDSEMDKVMTRYGELQTEYQSSGGYDLETEAKTILNGLGIDSGRWDNPIESFSGGWKMRIVLAGILLLNPDVLLIDEPTNHLDIETIIWLEEWLKNFKGSLVMTCHDREFMTRICKRTIEVAPGTITVFTGDYEFYLKERIIRRQQLIASKSKQDAMLAGDEEFIAKFAARASHAAQVQSRVKKIGKIERIVIPSDPKVMKIKLKEIKRSGDIVVDMDNLSKEWDLEDGTKHPVFSGLTGIVERGNKIALTGINGAGKSTLLKVITGQAKASSGSCSIGVGINMGYFSQYSCDLLNPKNSVYDEVSAFLPNENQGYVKSLLGSFQFSEDDIYKKISILSGGEKSRVVLATLFAQPLNFLVLDEPTNHLDIASREILLEALEEFEGTMIIVSHDRYFLGKLANRVFEIDHGNMKTFEGDYSYYLSKKE